MFRFFCFFSSCLFSFVCYNKPVMSNVNFRYKAVIFDMDGTILDTIEDLRDALNFALEEFGHRHDYSAEETCAFFGSGALSAIMRALAAEAGLSETQLLRIDSVTSPTDRETAENILEFYKPYYAAHCDIKTGPFPGIPELLSKLKDAGILTAVVSNKPDPAVQELCLEYFPGGFSHAAGEQIGIRRKPEPDMVLATLKELGVSAEDAVYIGDSEVDMETAENSGLDLIMVDWGFRSRRFLEDLGAETIVSSCEQLEALLMRQM